MKQYTYYHRYETSLTELGVLYEEAKKSPENQNNISFIV